MLPDQNGQKKTKTLTDPMLWALCARSTCAPCEPFSNHFVIRFAISVLQTLHPVTNLWVFCDIVCLFA